MPLKLCGIEAEFLSDFSDLGNEIKPDGFRIIYHCTIRMLLEYEWACQFIAAETGIKGDSERGNGGIADSRMTASRSKLSRDVAELHLGFLTLGR